MTVIAWDGATIATDSQAESAFIRPGGVKKIYALSSDVVVGFAGELQKGLLALEWLNSEDKNKPDPDRIKDISILMIRNGKGYELFDLLIEDEISFPFAIGSGGGFAMAAMLHGATAAESVATAIRLDSGCGGEIQSMSVFQENNE